MLAIRPKTLWAAAAPVTIGTALAMGDGALRIGPALAALVGALLIQIATNLANDYFDFVKGSDTGDRVGPTRVTQAGLLTPQAVKRGMWVTLALALGVGAYLVGEGGWPILVVGVASLLLAVGYTAGPVPLAYLGLGDPFVFVFFGPVAVGGTYWVQAGTLPPEVLWAGVGPGAIATAILVVNNVRDRPTDAATGKNTLAVRFGDTFSRSEYLFLFLLAWHVPPVGVAVFDWPWLSLGALLAFPLAIPPIRLMFSVGEERALLNPALGSTARFLAVFSGLLAVGLAFG